MSRSIRSARTTIIAAMFTLSSGLFLAAARAPAPGDACSLFPKEDAAAALGEAASGPKATGPIKDAAGPGSTVSACEYTGSGLHKVQLNLTRLAASSVAIFKGMCTNAKAGHDGLTGLGEVACWYNAKHAELHAFKGSVFLSVEMNRSGNPTEPIKALMKKALARLK